MAVIKYNNILLLSYAALVLCHCCCCEEMFQEVPEEQTEPYDDSIETAIQKLEALSITAEQMTEPNIADNAINYGQMISEIDDLNKKIKVSDNVYKFLEVNGILRVLSRNLVYPHPKLRVKLLILLKDIFDLAPMTTDAVLPMNLIDRLMDIFENDNLALKAHALDILNKWLPNNPKAQVRVMKVRGLETFYNQIEKLDTGVIQTLMDLFNKILKEHLDARNNREQLMKDDGETLVMYQRIGLLERLSHPKICKGLLTIFEILWSFNNNESGHVQTVLELVKNVKPFCWKTYSRKAKAIDLFKVLLKFLKNEDRKAYFEDNNVNVTEYVTVIEDYLDMQKPKTVKDEF